MPTSNFPWRNNSTRWILSSSLVVISAVIAIILWSASGGLSNSSVNPSNPTSVTGGAAGTAARTPPAK